MEINNIPYNDSVVFLEDDMTCIRISSEDNTACNKLFDAIRLLFGDAKIMYKFISVDEDLEAAKELLKNESVKYFKGRSALGFFTLSYPELHAVVSHSENLLKLLENWTSTIYQTHVLYITASENVDFVCASLERDVHKDTDSIESIWSHIKIAIRNQPEAEYHNTFLIFTHNEYLETIKKAIIDKADA